LAVKEKPRNAGFFFALTLWAWEGVGSYLISSAKSLMILSALAEVSGMPSAP
jgi:hypothetical protein